jgi:hypothetical protein
MMIKKLAIRNKGRIIHPSTKTPTYYMYYHPLIVTFTEFSQLKYRIFFLNLFKLRPLIMELLTIEQSSTFDGFVFE